MNSIPVSLGDRSYEILVEPGLIRETGLRIKNAGLTGRCAIISFHSLEDRMVKRCFRELAKTSNLPPDLARKAGERVDPICLPIKRKPIIATDEEIQNNARSRSAKLRACEKVAP